MAAGIPGTGLGGIFYLFLALFMPINELLAALNGTSTSGRRRSAAFSFSMALAIMAGLIGHAWLMIVALNNLKGFLDPDSALFRSINEATMIVSPAVAMLPLYVFGALLVMLTTMRYVLKRQRLTAKEVRLDLEGA